MVVLDSVSLFILRKVWVGDQPDDFIASHKFQSKPFAKAICATQSKIFY